MHKQLLVSVIFGVNLVVELNIVKINQLTHLFMHLHVSLVHVVL
jgi:hypothetical protein